MARIAGVNIPTNKRVIVALTYIHGIGPFKARQIAEKLHLSIKTVETYQAHIKDKLSLHSGRELVQHAIQANISEKTS